MSGPSPKKESPLSEHDLALFVARLRDAADHSLDAGQIRLLPGFQRLSEGDQILIIQRADQQRADRTLVNLEEEWKRWSFDCLITPKFDSKYQADGAFYSVLRLASERKWETLETFLETATRDGIAEARKQWRRQEDAPLSSLVWPILWAMTEIAFIAVLLFFVQPGFPAVVVSVLVLIYVTLSNQISETGFLAWLSLSLTLESQDHDTSEEDRGKRVRALSRHKRATWVRKIGLAMSELIAIAVLVVKGLL